MEESTVNDRYARSEFIIWNEQIEAPDASAASEAQRRWDAVAKPIDGLGRLEKLVTKIAGIQKSADVSIDPAALIILCADNGIVEEGVSQSGQEVTAAVARSMAAGNSSACRMAREAGVDVLPVDIGVAGDLSDVPEFTWKKKAGLLRRRIRSGTGNFLKESALTPEEAFSAIETGTQLAKECAAAGSRILFTGEMGIGNTTTSAALTAALLNERAENVCGRGAGLDDAGMQRKCEVVSAGLKKYGYGRVPLTDPEEVFRALCSFGGLDIAGLAGVFIGGAMSRLPVVIDGVISAVAALIAARLVPACRAYQLASHAGRERSCMLLTEALELTPVISADLALGEGTGALLLKPLLEMALAVYRSETGFGNLAMEPYERYDSGKERT